MLRKVLSAMPALSKPQEEASVAPQNVESELENVFEKSKPRSLSLIPRTPTVTPTLSPFEESFQQFLRQNPEVRVSPRGLIALYDAADKSDIFKNTFESFMQNPADRGMRQGLQDWVHENYPDNTQHLEELNFLIGSMHIDRSRTQAENQRLFDLPLE